MSELKAISSGEIYKIIEYEDCYRTDDLYYPKSEADKVISDLEESHKKEVEQLLMEIMKLKHSLELASNECCSISERGVKNARHHKYKRCLDKAEMCQARYDEEDAKVNGRGASWDYTSPEMKYWERWRWRWDALADKFKPNN